ncbi:uncharacterized protein HMPREF1541_02211 [Cyphellophora europaea CBS 101466]|uniref:Uncharacterized protein n=1 Tax=Cyphellophora europaea (strain CBS 101466) TaxID=1220924 RepID=W2S4T2_CYPE1|nr:uncharacterized protein HMPREF1541_02211 [Cyphellophora europaea CBS 101466]ETN43053.1 hypothetical protein HMPREF1541_02211 [Cyphellophora europaea CBS 101466]
MKPTFLTLPLLATAIPPHDRDASRVTNFGSQRRIGAEYTQPSQDAPSPHLKSLVGALEVMQDEYFDTFSGTWPAAIDWTAAVMGTQVSATLSSIVSSFEPVIDRCPDALWWQNIINKYFAHTSFFYFGENAFALRNQAYDDMLWVVLGWLENIKFSEMYSARHFQVFAHQQVSFAGDWHGLQLSPMAAHRARIFYDLASDGWDESLCHGGMNWNPYLTPYKNAITNELFTSASIAMYLYFPGDNNSAPFLQYTGPSMVDSIAKPHNPLHLENAIKSYKWLQESRMTNRAGLYQDGYHVTGWHRYPNGTIDRGTGECDELSTMVFTYNQGVILSASRGLWMATGARSYLDDGHALIESVIRATGWPSRTKTWHGLGRGGVMEEYCDHRGQCSQDGQTFKGIFFWHLAEFCRPLWATEEDFISVHAQTSFDRSIYQYHLDRCAAYKKWIIHNAEAAEASRDGSGRFGMWWTFGELDAETMREIIESTQLPDGAEDLVNPKYADGQAPRVENGDINDRGRGRTVETQAGGLAVLRARWNWDIYY